MWECNLSPRISVHLYSEYLICIATFSYVVFTGDTYLFFDLTLHLSEFLSKASLGLRDIDFDAVCALSGRVLAKRGSFLSSQQALASLLSLFLCRRQRRDGWKVCTLLTAQRWSPLTRLLWYWRGCLLLVLCWSDKTWQTEGQSVKDEGEKTVIWQCEKIISKTVLNRLYLFRQVWQTRLWQTLYADSLLFLKL